MTEYPSHRCSALLTALVLVSAASWVSTAQADPITYYLQNSPAYQTDWEGNGTLLA